MFHEVNELDRVRHAKRVGFKYLEWLFPYNRSVAEIKQVLTETDTSLVLVNTALGNPKHGERGIGAVPGKESEFRRAIEETVTYASQLSVPRVHVMAGIVPDAADRIEYTETFIKNLDWLICQTRNEAIEFLVEPLNGFDIPNYLITSIDDALDVLDPLNGPVNLQFDFYHLQLMGGNLAAQLRQHFDKIRHVQFSSVPGRHEPQYGEVNCHYLFDLLAKLGYGYFVGCEYQPKTTVEEGLSWADSYNFLI